MNNLSLNESNSLVQQIAIIVSVTALTLSLIAGVVYLYLHPDLPVSARPLLTKDSLVDSKGNLIEPYCFTASYGTRFVETDRCIPTWAERVGSVTKTDGIVSATYQNKGSGSVEMHSYKILDLQDDVVYIQAIDGTPGSPRTHIFAITSDWSPNSYDILWSYWGEYSDYGVTDIAVGHNIVAIRAGLGAPYFFHNRTDRTNAIEGIYVNGEFVFAVLNPMYDITWRKDQEPDPDYECVVSVFDARRKSGAVLLTSEELTQFGADIVAECSLEEYGVGL